LCFLALTACEQHRMAARDTQAQSLAAASKAEGGPAERVAHTEGRTLAYEHTVGLELRKELLPARINDVRDACDTHKDFECTVLDVSISADLEVPSGRIRLRLAPTGVEPLIQIAAASGRITSRTTHAEDLAQPIADTERELTLLSTHRDRLSEFLSRKDLKVEQEISLSKEISSTQMKIDSLNTQRANLRRRVDTDLLTIELSPPKEAYIAQQTPIRDALRSFRSDFRDAVAQVIRFTAALVPWLVIIIPGIVLLRVLWRSITRWLLRREQRSSARQ
jgi:hypothetical protein